MLNSLNRKLAEEVRWLPPLGYLERLGYTNGYGAHHASNRGNEWKLKEGIARKVRKGRSNKNKMKRRIEERGGRRMAW